MLKIATWNVNSIKMRQGRLVEFLKREKPNILCLQELKCVTEAAPTDEWLALGYHSAVLGQKTYNGVAVLSDAPITNVVRGLPTFESDPSARFVLGQTHGISVASCYVPNGQEVGSDKYAYKLKWLQALKSFLEVALAKDPKIVLGGDFNIAPEDRDVHDPDFWRGKILFSDPEKAALKDLTRLGFEDTFRKHHSEAGLYSWWDYRSLGFPKNHGLRIDFVLAAQALAPNCTSARIDRDERKGQKPSDHAPVLAEFNKLPAIHSR
jgi:exodeoxyribonuclease-3